MQKNFREFVLESGSISYGDFTIRSGAKSNYFFNVAAFNSGTQVDRLAWFYSQLIISRNLDFDILFGPAYKGIQLVVSVAMKLSLLGVNKNFSYIRKEHKPHGEGGKIVGADLARKKVLVIDDVISSGITLTETIYQVLSHKGVPSAVVVAIDREEVYYSSPLKKASDYIRSTLSIPVYAISKINDIIDTSSKSTFVDTPR